jgi:hypothetical protein
VPAAAAARAAEREEKEKEEREREERRERERRERSESRCPAAGRGSGDTGILAGDCEKMGSIPSFSLPNR